MLIECAIFLCALLATHWALWRGLIPGSSNWGKNLPPSIYGFPLVGVLPFMAWNKNHVKLAQNTANRYGHIYRARMGLTNIIMVNGSAAVKEALKNDDLLGRPRIPIFELLYHLLGGKVLIGMEGPEWKNIRNFSVHALRDLGFGKTPLMEAKVQEEIKYFLHDVSLSTKAPHDPRESLLASVSNNISTLVFGDRLPYTHPKRRDLNGFLLAFVRAAGLLISASFVPGIRAILELFGVRAVVDMKAAAARAKKVFENETNQHYQSYQPGAARDFMDTLIEKQRSDPSFDESVIRGSCVAFFGAGSNTSRMALEYLLQLAAAYPHLQEKVYQEIIREVGDARLPCWADKEKLHRVNAFIQERHRIFSIVPFGIFRRAMRDTQISGFDVPKGTVVVYNLHSVHNDPTVFDDPHEFNPERFIDPEGKFIPSNEVIPFAIGKRACPGETFAVFEIFLYFAAIIQRYRILPGQGSVKLSEATQAFSEPFGQPLRFIDRVEQ